MCDPMLGVPHTFFWSVETSVTSGLLNFSGSSQADGNMFSPALPHGFYVTVQLISGSAIGKINAELPTNIIATYVI